MGRKCVESLLQEGVVQVEAGCVPLGIRVPVPGLVEHLPEHLSQRPHTAVDQYAVDATEVDFRGVAVLPNSQGAVVGEGDGVVGGVEGVSYQLLEAV